QVHPRSGAPPVGGGECDLLTDDRREVAVEGEQELLDLTALGVARRSRWERAGVGEGAELEGVERGRLEEAEERVGAAVVQEAEAADLVALEAVVAGIEEGHPRHPEHPDLLILVPE